MHTATRIDVLRDSLDSAKEGQDDEEEEDIQRMIGESLREQSMNASVLDETTGQIVKVIFDPVLKCYYEPSRNVYY